MTSFDAIKLFKFATMLLALFAANGCASIAKGVTSAVLGGNNEIEDRLCRIDGSTFEGLDGKFVHGAQSSTPTTMRMLIVHGIGPHTENYSENFVRLVTQGLNLDVRELQQKRIRLGRAKRDPFGVGAYGGDELGWLAITRYTNSAKSRELLVFEVLWSEYNQIARDRLIDSDKDTAKLRASVNNTIKSFFNQQVIDPVKYIGDNAEDVRGHVRQASCWMLSGEWDDYPNSQSKNDKKFKVCPLLDSTEDNSAKAKSRLKAIVQNDELVAVTHSLGSRIFLDAFTIQGDEKDNEVNPFDTPYLGGALFEKDVTVIMLANQLPLLQEGLNDADGFGYENVPWRNKDRYDGNHTDHDFFEYPSKQKLCADPNIRKSQRRFKEMSLISVTDPNDLLSYRLMVGDFVDDYIDWRLCANVTEVLIGVAKSVSVFGLDFSNPADAHGNYWTDAGLSQLLLRGTKGLAGGKLVLATDKSGRAIDTNPEDIKSRYKCDITKFE